MFNDVTTSALRVALGGLNARQNAIADNIANIETPGYRAKRVQFEQALSQAVAGGDSPSSVAPQTATSLEPTRLNGSNVNLDHETLSQVDTSMRYQLAIRALDGKYSSIRSAIKGA